MKTVIGIDEVGRGCWAGPLLVVAARQRAELPEGVKDSKLTSKRVRSQLYDQIANACDIGEGWVMPAEIDHLGLSEAMRLGTERALQNLNADYSETIIFDGHINFCDPAFVCSSAVIGADNLFPIVSAASIHAKVTRDRFMAELPERYNVYEFDRHVGYGTKLHSDMLKKYGVSDIHRQSYAPIKKLVEKYS